MINRPNNWNEVKEFADRQKLPVGAYVCKVKKAAVQRIDYGEVLCVAFDIVEGDYSGYYADEFASNTNADKKWKGVLRQWLPKEDGSEKDEWTKSSLKGMTTAFEKSNSGYQWNWDENSLAGKRVGIMFRNEEWEYNGKTGWTAKPFKAISVDSVINGTYTLPKDKELSNKAVGATSTASNSFNNFAETDQEDDLPF